MAQNYCCLHILLLFFCSIATLEIVPHVEIPLGKIQGILEKSFTGRTFYSFNGIPYAEPPIGKDRFKEPIPKKPWKGYLRANTKHECLQYSDTTRVQDSTQLVHGYEDCLFVNVFTPDLEGRLDVLLYIHGGGFFAGSGGNAKPYIMMDRDVVLVTFNYRLGVLGFLCTEDNVSPGNYGLKDQILALNWVKENIKFFGGNENLITIFGVSAGGASVHFHTLSPKSKGYSFDAKDVTWKYDNSGVHNMTCTAFEGICVGLFHRAISSSGTMLNPWTLMKRPLERTKELALIVGCPRENVSEMVDCIRERPSKQILTAVYNFHVWFFTPFVAFGPVIDKWSKDPVLPEHPYKLLKKKKVNDVPWMIGQMAVEGLTNGFKYYSQPTLKVLDDRWNELMQYVLHYNYTVKPANLNTVGYLIRKEYLGNEPVTLNNLSKLLTLLGDRLFNAYFDHCARLQAAAIISPVYYYWFNYRGARSSSEITSKSKVNFGASHGDDQLYLVNSRFDALYTKEDIAMSKVLVDMYLSFAKSGQPETKNIKLEPVSKNENDPLRYLRIDSPLSVANREIKEFGNKKFWNSLPIEENEKYVEPKH